jgi:hypothetical protein
MIASVDTTIASTVATSITASKAWTLLHTSYANKSHTRIYSLRDQLTHIHKEDKNIAEYLHQIKSISNELATTGSPMTPHELTIKILTGLRLDYREVSAAIRNRSTPIEYKELFEKLIDHEIYLQHKVKKSSSIIATVA